VQSETVWEDVDANLRNLDCILSTGILSTKVADLVVLPETFSTGFSMNTARLAESMQGPSVQWMQEKARSLSAVVTGSIIIRDNQRFFNRLLWVSPTGSVDFYDKRHLFSLMGEDRCYTPGVCRKVFSVHGWRVCPQVCYDLRFPVWCRNASDYDLLLFVANWPVARHLAWRTLLQARAIENQSYVLGLNRAGLDGNNVDFGGASLCFDPLGTALAELGRGQQAQSVELDGAHLSETRQKLPFLKDGDSFSITPL